MVSAMRPSIDEALDLAFTPDNFKQAFQTYKDSKRDQFSSKAAPCYRFSPGADGVSLKDFEKQLDVHGVKICKRIHDGTYQFYPFREVQVEKEPARIDKPAAYRILSIATLRDTLVQIILYKDVLYKPIEALFSKLDRPQSVSFAYRKNKSAQQVAMLVYKYIQQGYYLVFDADIKAYFDTISHDLLLDRISQVLGGRESRTFNLIRRFVKTDRVPHDSYTSITFFNNHKPKRAKRTCGIPQGGVVSGMLANLYLHDFDQWVMHSLAHRDDIRYIRYADDFIMLAKRINEVDRIASKVHDKIEEFYLHINEDKTSVIDIRTQNLNFVGFQFSPTHIYVRDKNIDRYKARIIYVLEKPPKKNCHHILSNKLRYLRWVSRRIAYKVQGSFRVPMCPTCRHARIEPPRSWIAFFKVITDKSQLHRLDSWTREMVSYCCYKLYRFRVKRVHLRKAQFKSLVGEYYRVHHLKLRPCECDLGERGLWKYAQDLYENKYFYTAAQRKPFRVGAVTDAGLEVSTNYRKFPIRREVIDSLITEVKASGTVHRTTLVKRGIQHSNQLIALLSVLPGLNSRANPVRLIDESRTQA
jgi:RNA-directed DNA polymerase